MDTNITLKSIFASSKENLSSRLSGLALPKDSQRIQTIVSDFLNTMFENDGSFRQNLTESEDFLLQASLRLLQAQQNIAVEFAKVANQTEVSSNPRSKEDEGTKINSSTAYISAVGAGVGAFAGGLIGTWATVAGAIAGTALVIYCSTRVSNKANERSVENKVVSPTINPSAFCSIVEKICESIDGVIDTYRVQVKRIANAYEQREQPSMLNTYSTLSEQIANVIQASKTCSEVPSKLKNAISIMEETLENYDLKFENGKIVNA